MCIAFVLFRESALGTIVQRVLLLETITSGGFWVGERETAMANGSTRIDPVDREGEVQLMNSETLQRTGSQMSLGAVFGYCAAKALQWLGNVAAIGVGGAFAAAQTASYFGYIGEPVCDRNIT